eukprot:674773-Pyramimonas_sp.AAC.1
MWCGKVHHAGRTACSRGQGGPSFSPRSPAGLASRRRVRLVRPRTLRAACDSIVAELEAAKDEREQDMVFLHRGPSLCCFTSSSPPRTVCTTRNEGTHGVK